MGKDAPSPPSAPDPAATAAAQGAANRETAISNLVGSMVGQQTPYGNLSYAQTGSFTDDKGNITPQFTATTTLSPEQQQLLNLQTQGQINLGNLGISQLGRINDAVAQPFSYAGMPDAPVADDAYTAALKQSIITRNQPQMDRARSQLIQTLANQGITDPGSQPYMTAVDELNRSQNDFSLGADQTAASEMSQRFGLQEQARQQAIQEAAYLRSQPLNEFNSFMSGSQVTQPTFAQTPSLAQSPTDITGPTYAGYQGQLQANQIQAQSAASQNAGLFGLGSAGIGVAALLAFSDERLKENIEPIGMRDDGIGIYKYDYKWGDGPFFGVMAQEVERVKPSAVFDIGGVKAVDYGQLLQE